MRPFRIAVASGKGGTGKTTIATGLAVLLAAWGDDVAYADCDVEEPNGWVFINPDVRDTHGVFVTRPVVDVSRCTNCGRCSEVCRFNALAQLPDEVLVFPELCHGCGACALLCPQGAISEEPRRLGSIRHGHANGLGFSEGRLDVGEAHATPVIRALKRELPKSEIAILDAPPGASCPVVETVRGANLVVLVTEPTPFGLSDLEQAVGVVRAVAGEAVVVLNRTGVSDEGDEAARRLCEREKLPIIADIPEDREVAACLAGGHTAVGTIDGYAARLEPLVGLIHERSRM